MTDRPHLGRPIAPTRIAAAVLLALVAPGACTPDYGERTRQEAVRLTGGDPARGHAAIERYGCGSCHTIQGVRGARAYVGPPLVGIVERSYIAGVLENTPSNLQRWIMDPQVVDPRTAMPDLGVQPHEAKDIAAYLYGLR